MARPKTAGVIHAHGKMSSRLKVRWNGTMKRYNWGTYDARINECYLRAAGIVQGDRILISVADGLIVLAKL